jgi:uncharacterized protein YegJ (DUF2314 family)
LNEFMKWKLLLIGLGAALLAIAGIKLASNSAPADLQVAIATARRSLPRFRERLLHPESDDKSFFVRGRFSDGKHFEFLWLKRVEPTGDDFRGIVDENALVASGVSKGAVATVPSTDVVDWVILKKDGTTQGGFTRGLEP